MDIIGNKNVLVLFLAVLLLGSSGCDNAKNEEGDVLAKINQYEVTESHFKNAFLRYYYKSGQSLKPSFSIKSDVLNSEFNVYVLATYAEGLGLDNTQTSIRAREMITRRVLNEEYSERVILDGVEVSENELREMFVKLNTQLRASHLYAKSKEEAEILYNRLQQGDTFESLAREVFQNSQLATSGGDLGVFGVDEMDVAFEQAAYALQEGEYSKPVKTAQGYSIIKVRERLPKPVLSEYEYASNKEQIRYFVEKQKRELKSRSHMFNFMEELSINTEVSEKLWDRIKNNYTSFQGYNFEFLSNSAYFNEEIAANTEFSLSAAGFVRELRYTPSTNLNRIDSFSAFNNLITGIAYRTFLMQQAKSYGIDEIPEVTSSIDQSYYTYLAKLAEDRIREDIEVTEDEIREFYFNNQSDFVSPLEVNVSRIAVGTEKQANQIKSLLDQGTSFTDLVQEYTIRNEERLYDGVLGYKSIHDFGYLSQRISKLEPGEISEPMLYQTGEYHIYKNLGRKEPRQLSFSEARDVAEQKIRKKKFQERRAEIIEDVKVQNDATVDIQKLKKLTIQI